MRTGNLLLFPGIFPDRMAPIVRTGTDGERELVVARWGMPGARIGEDGSAGGIAASSRQRHFASTLTPSRARCPFGSP
jgi:putative SOS response-associated peptidase YedK